LSGLLHRRHFGALGSLLLLFGVVGLERGGTRREAAARDQGDIRSPQFFDQKAAGIGCGGAEIAGPSAEAKAPERPSAVAASASFAPVAIFASP
jgi:hypothetical protein